MSKQWTRSTRRGRRAGVTYQSTEAKQQLDLQLEFAPAQKAPASSSRRLVRSQQALPPTNKTTSGETDFKRLDSDSPKSLVPDAPTYPGSSDAILRLPAVKAKTGLSRSTIYDRIDKGIFPAPVPLGGQAVGWPASDIDAWIARTIAQGRKTAQ